MKTNTKRRSLFRGSTSMKAGFRTKGDLHRRKALARQFGQRLLIVAALLLTIFLTMSAQAGPIAIMPLGDSIT